MFSNTWPKELFIKPKFISKVLGQFRTKQLANWFIEDNYWAEFRKDNCQWSKFEEPEFITIEK